jgi:2-oxoisovalerate dehydrogenase E1 component
VVEAETYRWHGHYEGDPERYRTADEVLEWRARDPLEIHACRLRTAGIGDERLTAMAAAVDRSLDDAVESARRLPAPAPDTASHYVLRPRPTDAPSHSPLVSPVPAALAEPGGPGGRTAPPHTAPRHTAPPTGEGAEGGEPAVWRTMDAVRAALEAELEADERVFVAGIDVAAGGNVFGLMRGLHDRFGDRVRDTPISETAIVGLGVGAAMAGMRPVVELMYLDFVGVCLDQLLNQAAKLPFMTGGAAEMGLTVRTQFGAGRSSGSQHSQSLEALLAHIPGLSVVMPSTPADTYGLLRAAIQDPNPVVFIENRLLYGKKGPQPPPDHLVPIGRSAIVREGTDVTVVSVSRMVHEALAAADELATEGISVEVIDLRTVAPLDMAPILDSVARTSRLLVAHEAVVPFGIGAEIAAVVAREAFWDLDAPVHRLGAAPTPPPYAPSLESAWLPSHPAITTALRHLLAE